jgi:hypothetical protein
MKRMAYGSGLVLALSACKGTSLYLGQNDPPLTIAVSLEPPVGGLGVNGQLKEAMSTSLQPAPWQYEFFTLHPAAAADLAALNPQHIHIQAVDRAVPWIAKTGNPVTDWDFSELDAMVPQIVAVDPGAMFQVMPPLFLTLDQSDPSSLEGAIDDFATYCGYLVEYYNGKGIIYPADAGTVTVPHPEGTQRIAWWSIFGDFNVGTYPLLPAQYEAIYDKCVTQMVAANGDSGAINFSAFEFSDPPGGSSDSGTSLPSQLREFLAAVTGPIHALSLHMYSTLNLEDGDETVFQTVPEFASDLRTAYAQLANAGPTMANTAIWVTQNNVNGNTPDQGNSSSDKNQLFVNDPRGTDAFFAAWRPYVFSQFGKAGNRALYHWDYTAGNLDGSPNPDTDLQQAEVDYVSGNRLISYWVDYWLAHMFPSSDSSAALDILRVTGGADGGPSDFQTRAASAGVEVLATRNEVDRSVVVMVVDFATEGSPEAAAHVTDGKGAPRRVLVDVSALAATEPFASGTLRVIFDPAADNSFRAPAKPVDVSTSPIPVDLPGYGVAFLKLVPATAFEGGIDP